MSSLLCQNHNYYGEGKLNAVVGAQFGALAELHARIADVVEKILETDRCHAWA